MLRAAALSLLILVSVAVMLPLVDSSAHNSATPTAAGRRSHMRHRHSRAWWRRYRARLRRQRAAVAKHKQQGDQARRGQNMNAAPAEADSHNSNHAVYVNLPASSGNYKNPASALSLPQGWVRRAVNGETKVVLNAPNGQYIGGATFSLVNANAPGETTMMTARGNRRMLGGVPVAELRRTVIDKMIAGGGWVVNDMSREIGGHPVFIVLAQTAASSDGRTPQLSWVFYFTEVEGRIYSLAVNSLQEFSDRIADDSTQLIATFLANSRSLPVATSQR